MTASRNEQIVNKSTMYINGMNLAYIDADSLFATPGQCRDSTNTVDIPLNNITTLNFTTNGLNGLDTGTIAASTFYYIYVIYDWTLFPSRIPGLIASSNIDIPLLPAGYTNFKRIGTVLTDSFGNVRQFYQSGAAETRYIQYDTPITVLNGGNAITATLVNLGLAVPPFQNASAQGLTKISYVFNPNTAGNSALLKSNLVGGIIESITGQVASISTTGSIEIIPTLFSSNPSIAYSVSSALDALALKVIGYQDLLL